MCFLMCNYLKVLPSVYVVLFMRFVIMTCSWCYSLNFFISHLFPQTNCGKVVVACAKMRHRKSENNHWFETVLNKEPHFTWHFFLVRVMFQWTVAFAAGDSLPPCLHQIFTMENTQSSSVFFTQTSVSGALWSMSCTALLYSFSPVENGRPCSLMIKAQPVCQRSHLVYSSFISTRPFSAVSFLDLIEGLQPIDPLYLLHY